MHIGLDVANSDLIAHHVSVVAAGLLFAALTYTIVYYARRPKKKMPFMIRDEAGGNWQLEEYQTVISEALPGALCTYRQNRDGSSELIFASANFEDVCGIAPGSAWQGEASCFQHVHPADIPKLKASIAAAARRQTPWQAEYRLKHPRKGEVWIEERSTPKLQPDGTLLWHGVIFDITDRKVDEQNLILGKERLTVAIEAAKLGVFDNDLRQHQIFVSDRLREIVGWPVDQDVSFDDMLGAIHPDDRSRIEAEIHAAHDKGGSGYLLTKYRIRRPDGSERWIVSRSATVLEQVDGVPKPTRVIGCVLDVTENMESEDVANRWLKLFEASGFGLAQIRVSDNTFIVTNRAFAEQRGYEPAELVGQPMSALYPKDRWTTMMQLLASIDRDGHMVYETMHLKKDGSTFPALMEMTVVNGVDEKPATRIAYSIDLSHLRKTENALLETQQLHLATVSALREGVIVFSTDGHVLSCNPSAERILGMSLEEIKNRRTRFPDWPTFREDGTIFPPEEFPVVRALKTGQPCEGVVMGAVKTIPEGDPPNLDEVTWILVNAAPVLDPKNEFCGSAVVSFVDITSRKIAEREQAQLLQTLAAAQNETQRQRNLFKSIFDGAPDAMIETDLNRIIRSVNPAIERIFGYEAKELAGQRTLQLYATEDDWQKIGEHLEASQRTDFMIPQVVDFVRKNGEFFPGVINGATLKDENQNPIGYIAVVRDIKQERERDKALEEAKRLESLGRLTAGIAHDFNNLLTVISVNLQLIDMSVYTRDMKRKVQAALLATNIGAKLNQRLTGMAHKRRLNATPLNLNVVVRDLYDILRVGLGERSTLKLALAPDLRLTNVDSSEVENMLINLVINSRDAMPEGGLLNIVTGNVDVHQNGPEPSGSLPAGQYVMVSVRDTGTGMPPEVLKRATDTFYTTKTSGSGLGLAAVSDFVKQSNGHLAITSAEGEGTTVTIHLPIYQENYRTDSSTPSIEKISHKQKQRILVVEDNQAVLDAVAVYLQSLGYDILTASDAPEALKAIADHQDIDLLFTDLVLPGGGSGQDLARTIRNTRPHMKVVFTSGYSEEEAHGGVSAKDILKKPYPLDDLQRVLAEKLAETGA